jgi:uncharacterized protein YprB with RNaseH-like and TPR domain
MSELREQLEALRERVARVNARYAQTAPARPQFIPEHAPEPENPGFPREYIENTLTGEEVQTSVGKHFETEKLYEAHRQHGSADIGALCDLPHDLFDSVSDGAVPQTQPTEWAFLDTETTGLAGGTGTCAFLIGVGRITPQGFRVRQFFMRDHGEEASALESLSRHLAAFKVLVTYNGRTFDQPLLETRYRLNRARPPFAGMEHVDLLYSARRLWKLRFESCRLVELENQILGVERDGDVPGALIPYLYFEYLRTKQAGRLLPVFYHNATDILTLACLCGIVPHAFKDPCAAPFAHGSEMVGIARWLRQAGELERARDLLRRAIDKGLKDELLFRTLWDTAAIERKLGADAAALQLWNDLAECRNPFRIKALEEMAKHHEHREKNYARALEVTNTALLLEDSDAWRHREQRLRRRVSRTSLPSCL